MGSPIELLFEHHGGYIVSRLDIVEHKQKHYGLMEMQLFVDCLYVVQFISPPKFTIDRCQWEFVPIGVTM